MTLTLLGAILLGFVALAYTLAPLFNRPTAPVADGSAGSDDARKQLESRRATVYDSIHDLDFELNMGKLTEDDHGQVRAELMREAADVLRQIDERGADDPLSHWIEAEVAARRKQPAVANECPSCNRSNPAGATYCDGCGGSLKAQSCTACGESLRSDARFCSHCGAKR